MHDDLRAIVNRRAQHRQCFLCLAFAVVAFESQLHLASGIHPFGRPQQITENRLARVAKRAAQAFDHGDFEGWGTGGLRESADD